jgi:hypothetical protein
MHWDWDCTRFLHEHGPMTVVEFAAAAGINERYLGEWGVASGGFENISPMIRRRRNSLCPRSKAMVFAIEDSPIYMMGAYDLMTWMTESKETRTRAEGVSDGKGVFECQLDKPDAAF